MLPATIFIGATLPLSVRVLARDESEATVGTARIYAWNTDRRHHRCDPRRIRAHSGPRIRRIDPDRGRRQFRFLALWAAGCVARPRPDPGRHRVRRYRRGACALHADPAPGGGVEFRIQRDLSGPATGVVLRRRALLHSDAARCGHRTTTCAPTACLKPPVSVRGTSTSLDTQKWLTALPVAARPDTRNMLVVGFGGGIALEGVPTFGAKRRRNRART